MDPSACGLVVSLGNIVLADGQTCETQSGTSKRNHLGRLSVVNDPPSSCEITTLREIALIKLGSINHFIS